MYQYFLRTGTRIAAAAVLFYSSVGEVDLTAAGGKATKQTKNTKLDSTKIPTKMFPKICCTEIAEMIKNCQYVNETSHACSPIVVDTRRSNTCSLDTQHANIFKPFENAVVIWFGDSYWHRRPPRKCLVETADCILHSV